MEVVVPLARRYLLAEKARFAMSLAGVAFAVLLVLVVTSLYRGWSGSSAFLTEFPGDLWVVQEGTSDPLRATSYLPVGVHAELEGIDGVVLAVPVYSRRIAVPAGDRELSAQFLSFVLPPGVPVSDEDRARFFPGPGSVVIDSMLADKVGLAAGGSLDVLDTTLVVEEVRPGGNPLISLVFVNGADAPELLGLDGYVSYFILVLAPDVSPDAVAALIEATIPESRARTSEQFAVAMADTVDEGFLPVVGALVAIGLVIGGAVVALTTYTATIEKAREFAVLKALGASGWFVYRVVIRQSAIVGLLGSLLGLGAALVVSVFVRRFVPEFVTETRWPDALGVIALTTVVSLIAAYVPVRRIDRIDPAMVFRA